MIDKKALQSIAKLYGMRPWQQEKHYLQSLILISLSEFPIVFKGGTYLWFFHDLKRFSEDLDFTATAELPVTIGENILETLNLFGVECKIKTISDSNTSLSLRFSAKGPLNTTDADICHVYVEISKREKVVKTPMSFELNFEAYKMPLKIINGMNLDEVAAEKVRAIVGREKARDVYDLFYLIEKKNVNFEEDLINEKLNFYDMKFSQDSFSKSLRRKEHAWKNELKPLLFGDLPDFNSVVDVLENWAQPNG